MAMGSIRRSTPSLFLELVGKPVDDHVVEVVAAEVGVTVGRFNFKHTVAKFKDGDVECAAAKVEYGDLLVGTFLCRDRKLEQLRWVR